MRNQRDIRRRISSVLNTQQITKAMKMIAAVRLRKAQQNILHARPYTLSLREVLANLSSRVEHEKHPLLSRRQENRIILCVVAADKGLCGSFNTNIIKKANAFLEREREKDITLFLVGKRCIDFYSKRGYTIQKEITGISTKLSFSHAEEIAREIIASYTEESFDSIYFVYNEFLSVLRQRVVEERCLPIPEHVLKPGSIRYEYLYEPSEDEILRSLLPEYVETQVWRILLESVASEHGARMSAMDNASKNADEMIQNLTILLNKIRQASITREIVEVVSGVEALEG